MGIDAVSERRSSYGSAIFYPETPEKQEENKIILPFDQYMSILVYSRTTCG